LAYVAESSDADGVSNLGSSKYRFTRLGGSSISYQISVPSSAPEGDYTITGTFTDGEKASGEIGGTNTFTVDDVISQYTDPDTGKVEKDGAVRAVNDYLFEDTLTKEEAVAVVNAYLFG